MNYRAYNENNICKRTGIIFATYFRTKKEALAHIEKYGGVLEKRMIDHWISWPIPGKKEK